MGKLRREYFLELEAMLAGKFEVSRRCAKTAGSFEDVDELAFRHPVGAGFLNSLTNVFANAWDEHLNMSNVLAFDLIYLRNIRELGFEQDNG